MLLFGAQQLPTAQLAAQTISISPLITETNIINGQQVVSRYFLLIAEQLARHSVSIQTSPDMVTWSEAAWWDCYPVPQYIVALIPDWQGYGFIRSYNEPCTVLAAGVEAIGPPEPMSATLLDWRTTIGGIVYRLGSLPAPLIPRLEGIRRFQLIPAHAPHA